MLKSYGGDKALRASTFSAFVNVVDEACRMRLDTRKVHLGTAFTQSTSLSNPLGPLSLFGIVDHEGGSSSDDFTTTKVRNRLEIVVLPCR